MAVSRYLGDRVLDSNRRTEQRGQDAPTDGREHFLHQRHAHIPHVAHILGFDGRHRRGMLCAHDRLPRRAARCVEGVPEA
jgi:hypothetical protein